MLIARKQYNTRQREVILDFLKQNEDLSLTVEAITNELKGQVGQTTVYRYLEKLANEKIVLKYDKPDGKCTYYKYYKPQSDAVKGCHLLCTECGKITALSCHFIFELDAHIRSQHQFNLDGTKTILYGVCGQCK